MTIKTLADCAPDDVTECAHCDEVLPTTAKAELNGNAVIVWCPACGCMTPFPTLDKKARRGFPRTGLNDRALHPNRRAVNSTPVASRRRRRIPVVP